MSYKKGELRYRKPCPFPTKDECHANVWKVPGVAGDYDAIEDYYQHDHENPGNDVWLPHSCDEWIIGDNDEIIDLIADLRKALGRARA
jgi:hypothetical protein